MLGTNSEETGELREMEKAVPKGLKEEIMERVGHSPSLNPVLPGAETLACSTLRTGSQRGFPVCCSSLLKLITEEGCVTPGPPTCDVVGPF